MATLPTYFSDYLKNIRMTDNQIQECKTGHDYVLRQGGKVKNFVLDVK